MTTFLLLANLALAAPQSATVAAGADATAVAWIVEGADGVRVAACADDGVAPDAAVDGRWSCPALPLTAGDRVGFVRNGRVVDAGDWTGSGPCFATLAGGKVTLATSGAEQAPVSGARSRGAQSLVVVRVRGLGEDAPSPMVRLQGASGSVQLACRDDGGFPDVERNDGQPGCVGAFAEPTARVALDNAAELGSVTWAGPGGLRYLTVDVAQRSLTTGSFALRLRPPAKDLDIPIPEPVVVEQAPPAPVQVDAVPPPAPAPAPAPRPDPSASSGPPGGRPDPLRPDAPASAQGWRWPSLAVSAALGALLAWGAARVPRRLPHGVAALPRPAALPGWPALEGAQAARVKDVADGARSALAALTRTHRVLLVRDSAEDAPAPHGHATFVATDRDRVVLEDAARALARADGAPLVVLVVGADTVTDAGGVAGDPLAQLANGLPSGVPLLAVVGPDARCGLPCTDVDLAPSAVVTP